MIDPVQMYDIKFDVLYPERKKPILGEVDFSSDETFQ